MNAKTPIVDENDFQTAMPRPWCRYFARIFDIILYGAISLFVIMMALSAVFPAFVERLFAVLETPGGGIIQSSLMIFLSGLLSAVSIGYTGTSIGKWIFGVKVTDHEGRKIGFKRAWQRELKLWFRGMAMGIPLIALYANYVAYKRLVNIGVTSWDEQMDTRVAYKNEGMLQTVKMIIGCTLIFIILAS